MAWWLMLKRRRPQREAALKMATRTIKAGSTLGAGKGYDTVDFVQSLCKLVEEIINRQLPVMKS
jgi:hypothetical protein